MRVPRDGGLRARVVLGGQANFCVARGGENNLGNKVRWEWAMGQL